MTEVTSEATASLEEMLRYIRKLTERQKVISKSPNLRFCAKTGAQNRKFGLFAGPSTFDNISEMFFIVFCHVDDLYKEIVPAALRERSLRERLECSDSEILTLSLMQEALSMDSDVRKNYLHLFPKLLSRDRYNRRRRDLTEVSLMLFRHAACFFKKRAQHLIAPVETAAFIRSQSTQVSMPEAAYGYIPSKKRYFFGFRLHGLVLDEGALIDFVLFPGDVDERTVAQVLLSSYSGHYILGDNGYSGRAMMISSLRPGYRLWNSPNQSQQPNSREEAQWRRWLTRNATWPRDGLFDALGPAQAGDDACVVASGFEGTYGGHTVGLQYEFVPESSAGPQPTVGKKSLPLIAQSILIQVVLCVG